MMSNAAVKIVSAFVMKVIATVMNVPVKLKRKSKDMWKILDYTRVNNQPSTIIQQEFHQ